MRMLRLAVVLLVVATSVFAAETGSGNLSYKGRTAPLKYAWLVTGPSDLEPGKTVRRLVLSSTDIGAKLAACKTLSCTDGEVTEGATVDFTGGPRINYWVAMNGQKVQYSGTATPDAFVSRGKDAARLAGKLAIDDIAAGGPKLDADVDVAVTKAFGAAR
jgi:hypothetical protein